MDAIHWLAILFVGLFVIFTISNIFSEKDLKDYVYSTTTNSTISNFNNTVNATHSINISGNVATIPGEVVYKLLTATVENRNTTNSSTITAYLNGASLGTFSASNNTNTSYTFTNVAFVNNGTINNVTYATAANGTNPNNIISSSAYYPTSKADSGIGGIFTNLNVSTVTAYNVLVLVLIVILLAVALRSLGRLNSASNTGSSM